MKQNYANIQVSFDYLFLWSSERIFLNLFLLNLFRIEIEFFFASFYLFFSDQWKYKGVLLVTLFYEEYQTNVFDCFLEFKLVFPSFFIKICIC